MNTTFDQIVGLGYDCRVAHHLRRFFSFDDAHIFDWWALSGESLVRLIENDFDGIFSEADLESKAGGHHLESRRYGSFHFHDFPRTEDGRAVAQIGPEELVRSQSKIDYLRRKWDRLSSCKSVLFVRYVWDPSESIRIQWRPSERGPAALLHALDRKFPNLDYRIALVDCPAVADPRVIRVQTQEILRPGEAQVPGVLDCKENNAIWDRILTSLNHSSPYKQLNTAGKNQT